MKLTDEFRDALITEAMAPHDKVVIENNVRMAELMLKKKASGLSKGEQDELTRLTAKYNSRASLNRPAKKEKPRYDEAGNALNAAAKSQLSSVDVKVPSKADSEAAQIK